VNNFVGLTQALPGLGRRLQETGAGQEGEGEAAAGEGGGFGTADTFSAEWYFPQAFLGVGVQEVEVHWCRWRAGGGGMVCGSGWESVVCVM